MKEISKQNNIEKLESGNYFKKLHNLITTQKVPILLQIVFDNIKKHSSFSCHNQGIFQRVDYTTCGHTIDRFN